MFGAWNAMACKHSCFFLGFFWVVSSFRLLSSTIFCLLFHVFNYIEYLDHILSLLLCSSPRNRFVLSGFSMAWVFPRPFPINFDLLFVMAIQQSDSGKCERAYKCMLQIRPDGNGWKDKQVKHACIVYMEHLIETTDDCFLAIFSFRSASSLLLVVSGLSVANASKKRISIALAFEGEGIFYYGRYRNGKMECTECFVWN